MFRFLKNGVGNAKVKVARGPQKSDRIPSIVIGKLQKGIGERLLLHGESTGQG